MTLSLLMLMFSALFFSGSNAFFVLMLTHAYGQATTHTDTDTDTDRHRHRHTDTDTQTSECPSWLVLPWAILVRSH